MLIELGKYARDGANPRTVLEFFETGEFALFHLNQRELDTALKDGRASLLLDGLDEIFDRQRHEAVIAEIKRLSLAYPKARMLVTTRIVGYQPQSLTDAGFRHFTLQDFDPKQINDFLDRWHRLISIPEDDKRSRHGRLQKAIRDSAAIRELARNPLLLTMLALVNRTQEIPRERVKAYSIICEVLLHHWDFERGLLPSDPDLRPDAIGLEEKLAMARLVAFEMQQASEGLAGNLISKDRLEEILSDYLKDITAVSNPRSLARRIIDRLHSRDAVLSFAGADSYRFIHRTFLEYFCASEFDRQAVKLDMGFEWLLGETVRKHWEEDTWHEVIRLIAGLSGETKAARIIDFLLTQHTYRARGSNIILAAQCLTELRQFTGIQQLAEVRRELSRLHKFEIVRGFFGQDFGADDRKREGEVRRSAVALQAALANDREAGKSTLASLAVTALFWDVRQAAVQELARGWPSDPDTPRWLRVARRIRSEWGCAGRRRCRSWHEAGPPIPIPCAGSSRAPNPMRMGLCGRRRCGSWHSGPPIPIPCAFSSRAPNPIRMGMRRAAVQELARGWPDPDTLRWLSRAPNPIRMGMCVGRRCSLARGWPSDPDTLRWLKSRAESDQDGDVRQAAVREL